MHLSEFQRERSESIRLCVLMKIAFPFWESARVHVRLTSYASEIVPERYTLLFIRLSLEGA